MTVLGAGDAAPQKHGVLVLGPQLLLKSANKHIVIREMRAYVDHPPLTEPESQKKLHLARVPRPPHGLQIQLLHPPLELTSQRVQGSRGEEGLQVPERFREVDVFDARQWRDLYNGSVTEDKGGMTVVVDQLSRGHAQSEVERRFWMQGNVAHAQMHCLYLVERLYSEQTQQVDESRGEPAAREYPHAPLPGRLIEVHLGVEHFVASTQIAEVASEVDAHCRDNRIQLRRRTSHDAAAAGNDRPQHALVPPVHLIGSNLRAVDGLVQEFQGSRARIANTDLVYLFAPRQFACDPGSDRAGSDNGYPHEFCF